MKAITAVAVIGAAVLSLVAWAADAPAVGIGDLKKKAEKKAKEAADKAAKKPDMPAPPAGESEASEAGSSEEGSPKGGDGGKVSRVSTKFDFVPGSKVLLMDDFTRDELGEFPARWTPFIGNFDVAEFEGERWLRLNGDDGTVAMKGDGLPEKWTLEFDIYQTEMTGPVFTITGFYENSPNSGYAWTCQIGGYGGESVYYSGPDGVSSAAPMPGGLNGRRHVSMMASGTSLKVYVDRERLVNIPSMDFTGRPGGVTALGCRFWRHQGGDPLLTNVRFAEGGKQKVDMMATPFVTHGIVFDSGSDRLKPESAAVLRQVSTYLKENAEVKVLITGHTDDVGDTAANQTLSEKRAAAVAASLSSDFGIDASRMTTAGKGESAPMAANDSPEGRATNRRVEFSKS